MQNIDHEYCVALSSSSLITSGFLDAVLLPFTCKQSAFLLDVHERREDILGDSTVSFVHRSAVEFLQNTEDGQQLLSYDLSRVKR